jgi:hypothetical protein
MRNRLATILTGLIILGTATALCAQSLGDVARKEEERRKHQAPAGKVYTNKDLESVPPSSVTPAPPDTKTSDTDKSKDGKTADAADKTKDGVAKDGTAKDAKDKGDPKGQAYWSGRRRALQDALDRDTTYQDALQSRINALNTDFVNRDDPVQRSTIDRDRQKALAELTRLKKQIQDDRQAIADLEEEARRAGVPPGWLR